MAETIRELLIKVGLDGQAAVAGMQKLDGSFMSMKTAALLAVGAATTVAGSLFAIAKSAARTGVELKKTSEIIGISTAEYQKLSGAAQLADVDQESFASGMRFFGKTVGMAMRGGKEQMEAFKKAGISSFKDVNGHMKTQSELLLEVAERMTHVKTAQEKMSIAAQLFGRMSGSQFIPFLSAGVNQIKLAEAAFEKFGYTLSENDIKNSERFNQELIILGMQTDGLKNKIGYALLPTLNKWGVSLNNLIGETEKLSDASGDIDFDKYSDFALTLEAIRVTFALISDEVSALQEKFNKLIPDFGGIENTIMKIALPAGMTAHGIGMAPSLKDYVKLAKQEEGSFHPAGQAITAAASKAMKTSKSTVTLNSNPVFTFNVPAGTSQDQQDWFQKSMDKHWDSALQTEIKNINIASPDYAGS